MTEPELDMPVRYQSAKPTRSEPGLSEAVSPRDPSAGETVYPVATFDRGCGFAPRAACDPLLVRLELLFAFESFHYRPDQGVVRPSHLERDAPGLSPSELDMQRKVGVDRGCLIFGLADELTDEMDLAHSSRLDLTSPPESGSLIGHPRATSPQLYWTAITRAYHWRMSRTMTSHLRFVLIWSAVAVLAAVVLLAVRLPLLIVLVALVWVSVLVGAWQWRPNANRVPSVSFSTWLRTPSAPSRSTPK